MCLCKRASPWRSASEASGWWSGGIPLTLTPLDLEVEPGAPFELTVRGVGVSAEETSKRQRVKFVSGADCRADASEEVSGVCQYPRNPL